MVLASTLRAVTLSDVAKCPNLIPSAHHYPTPGGKCGCYDPSTPGMYPEYVWSPTERRWVKLPGHREPR